MSPIFDRQVEKASAGENSLELRGCEANILGLERVSR